MNSLIQKIALQEAWKFQGVTLPNPAVSAVVMGGHGEILSIGTHQKVGMPHAEVCALQKAFSVLTSDSYIMTLQNAHEIHHFLLENHQGIFHQCSIFVSLEPCSHVGRTPSCAALLADLGFKRVVAGMPDESLQGRGGAELLRARGISVDFLPQQTTFKQLLYPFNQLQKNGRFIFFKFAQRLNGSIDGGIISSQNARMLTHHFRGAIDLLVISGKTLRDDRPLLDTRFAPHLPAPHVLVITSNPDSIDRSMPLFGVKGRKIHFSSDIEILSSLDTLGDYRSVMIEGGAGFFRSVEPYLDMIAVFVSPALHERGCIQMDSQKNWALWHAQVIEGSEIDSDNILLWLGPTNV